MSAPDWMTGADRWQIARVMVDIVFVLTVCAMWWTGAGALQTLVAAGCGLLVHRFLRPGKTTVGKPEWFDKETGK